MKVYNYGLCFLAIILLLSSCSEEFERIDEEVKLPESVVLINASMSGTVLDGSAENVDGATVQLLVDGIVLEETTTSNGTYSFVNQDMHQERSLIKVISDDNAPNIANYEIDNGGSISLDFIIDTYSKEDLYSTSGGIDFNDPEGLDVTIGENAINSKTNNVLLKSLVYNFDEVPRALINAKIATDVNSESYPIDFNQAFYIGAYNEDGTLATLNTSQNYDVRFAADEDLVLWKFDNLKARWTEVPNVTYSNGQYQFDVNEFTFFALSSNCNPDIDLPVPFCLTSSIVEVPAGGSATVFPSSIDFGSYDDCSPNITFQLKRTVDVCGTGSDVYGDSIIVCSSDIGTTIEAQMLVIDGVGNESFCIVSIDVQ